MDDLARLTGSLKRIRPFVIAADHTPAKSLDSRDLRSRLAPKPQQLSLFA